MALLKPKRFYVSVMNRSGFFILREEQIGDYTTLAAARAACTRARKKKIRAYIYERVGIKKVRFSGFGKLQYAYEVREVEHLKNMFWLCNTVDNNQTPR